MKLLHNHNCYLIAFLTIVKKRCIFLVVLYHWVKAPYIHAPSINHKFNQSGVNNLYIKEMNIELAE
jgi:hypothetical protein